MKRKLLSFLLALCIAVGMLSTAAAEALPAAGSNPALNDGWYSLYCMKGNYFDVSSKGDAVLRRNTYLPKYFVEHVSDNNYTIKTADGKYIGVSETVKNGVQVKAIDTKYLWTFRLESSNNIFSLRPVDAPEMILNAKDELSQSGTPLILWSYKKEDAPKHAEFMFFTGKSTPAPASTLVPKLATPKPTATPAAVTEFSIGEATFTKRGSSYVMVGLSGMKGVSKVAVKYILNNREINFTTLSFISSNRLTKSIAIPIKKGITEIKVYYYDKKGVQYEKSYPVDSTVLATSTPRPAIAAIVTPRPNAEQTPNPTVTPTPAPSAAKDIKIGEVEFNTNSDVTMIQASFSGMKGVSSVWSSYILDGKEIFDTGLKFTIDPVEKASLTFYVKPGATEARIYYYDMNNKIAASKIFRIGIDETAKFYTPSNPGFQVLTGEFSKSVPGLANNIVITENIKEIQGYAFYCSKTIFSFSLQNNPNFTVVDGVLFNKDMTKLIAYPQAKSGTTYTIPDSVVEIENGAFGHNKNLTEIKFGANVKTIGVDAFRICNFKEVVIPEGVKTINGCAFSSNASLKKITIPASVTSIANDILNNSASGVVVYGKAGTAAENFALRFGYRFGDSQAPAGTPIKASSFKLGDTEDKISDKGFKTIGASGGMWRLFGSYEKFLAVYFVQDKAAFIYTNDLSSYTINGNIYTDKNDNNKKYAASMGTLPNFDSFVTEQLVFEFTNAFRGVNGLPALKWNFKLRDAARAHSDDMNTRKFFDHVNPDGKNPSDRISAAGYKWRSCGENIAMIGSGFNVIDGVDGWVNSALHRANMLTTICDEIGVGVTGKYGTQNFGKQ